MYNGLVRSRRFIITLVLFIYAFIGASESARAESSLMAKGSVGFTEPQVRNWKSEYTGQLSYGAGLTYELQLGKVVGIEIGAEYFTRKFIELSSGAVMELKSVRVPVQFKGHLNRWMSLGGGVFADYTLGDISYNSGPVSLFSYGISPWNYGWIADFTTQMWLGATSAVYLQGRYFQGVRNLSDLGGISEFKYRDYQLSLGFQLVLAGKGLSR